MPLDVVLSAPNGTIIFTEGLYEFSSQLGMFNSDLFTCFSLFYSQSHQNVISITLYNHNYSILYTGEIKFFPAEDLFI